MHDAARLPVAVAGALMPDAHKGYGLPIGGVLATENAVIPYAVGVRHCLPDDAFGVCNVTRGFETNPFIRMAAFEEYINTKYSLWFWIGWHP